MKKVFKFIFACLIYIVAIRFLFQAITGIFVLLSNPISYLLFIFIHLVILWFFSIVYRFKLSEDSDLLSIFWKLPYKISQFIGMKINFSKNLFLVLFLANIFYTTVTISLLKIPHNVTNDLMNIIGILSLIAYLILLISNKTDK